ncbi:carbonic anhydrase family protein [Algoriphagus sp.]|uniref:carbonic anhydrase family protein n=1 Tax=Algoriphagus sp. TaxID=1872435 RepID=UPI00391885C0
MKKTILGLSLTILLFSCKTVEKPLIDDVSKLEENIKIVLEERVFSQEEQQALTPDLVLMRLMAGNDRFKNNSLTARNHSSQVRNSVQGQYPKAVILSCLDSRIPVEDVFDKGIGDLFVARVAGNFANPEILGSMEFACYVAGAKTIIVLGHQHCGAVKASIDNIQIGNIVSLTNGIRPAVNMASDYTGEKSSGNDPYVHYVSKKNVLHTVDFIRKNSPILKEMEEKGLINIVGAMYEMQTGNVEFYK